MTEQEFKKFAEKTMQEQIMKNLDSSLIFTYIRNLEEDLKKEKGAFKLYGQLIYQINEKEKYWRKVGNNIIADELKSLLIGE